APARDEKISPDSPALPRRDAQRLRKDAPLHLETPGGKARLLRSHIDADVELLERLYRLQAGDRRPKNEWDGHRRKSDILSFAPAHRRILRAQSPGSRGG